MRAGRPITFWVHKIYSSFLMYLKNFSGGYINLSPLPLNAYGQCDCALFIFFYLTNYNTIAYFNHCILLTDQFLPNKNTTQCHNLAPNCV